MKEYPKNPAAHALVRCGRSVAVIAIFSMVINVLMLSSALYMLQVFDRVLSSGSLETLLYLTLIAGSAVALLGATEAVRARMLTRTSVWFEQKLGPAAAGGRVDDAIAGVRDSRQALRDVAGVRTFLGSPAATALLDVPWVPVYLAVIYLLHPVLGHAALAGGVLLFILALLNDLVTRRAHAEAGQHFRAASLTVEAAERNGEAADALGMRGEIVRRWAADQGAALDFQAAAGGRSGIIVGGSRFLRLFLQIAILGLGAWLVVGRELTPGGMIAASILLGRALAPVEQAIGTWRTVLQANEARRRLLAYFAKPARRAEGMALPAPSGRLSVEQVYFGFERDKPPTIKGVSFEVRPGEALAVIGSSAAGKSTLARLLVGVHKPWRGVVRLDGADIFTWPREDLAPHLGYLPQDVELFGGTVAENIARLQRPDHEAVVAAAQMAHCHEMILRLPDGYHTELGERGACLSAGQRQRIALARALYGQPRLVVLDEPNANLDAEGEQALAATIRDLKAAGAAVIVNGHRPSTLIAVDRVLVLNDGAVERIGRPAEILQPVTRTAPMRRPIAPAFPLQVPPQPSAEGG